MPSFELLTRQGCHLCEAMEEEVRPLLRDRGLALSLVDVDSSPPLAERFGDVVPVLLRDGLPVAKVRLRPGQAVRLIRGRR